MHVHFNYIELYFKRAEVESLTVGAALVGGGGDRSA